jgi:DNA polymerase III subunit gamma/tau
LSTEIKYKVTALKWRPKKFKDVVFQSHVTTTLSNAIKTGRIAHAYLFCGPRGVGKTTIARIFSRAVNCLNPVDGEPCDECENCKLALEGRGLDIVEIDGASNRGIDDMRNLQESARYTPSRGKYKVFIIDEIHMITREGFNAFLKTLEEPPEHIIFIGATTEPIKVYPTIISRCQRFDFKRIPIKEILDRLSYIAKEENITIDQDSLFTIAKKGDGSLRDSQSIFDQVVSSCGADVNFEKLSKIMNIVSSDYYFRVSDLVKNKDTKGGIELVDEIIRQGFDLHEFILGLLDHFRNLMLTVVVKSSQDIEASDENKVRYLEDSKSFTEGDVLRIMKLLSEVEINYKYFNQPRLRFELALLQIIKMNKTIEIDTLLREFESFKKKIISSSPEQGVSDSRYPNTVQKLQVPGFKSTPKPEITPQTIGKPEKGGSTFSKFSLKNSFDSKSSEIQSNLSPNSGLTLEMIKQKWDNLLDEIMKFNKINLRSILLTAELSRFENNVLTFICSSELNANIINNSKSFLQERLEAVYGARFNLNPICPEDAQNQPVTDISNTKSPVQKIQNNSNSVEKDHPVVQALMREFGAEPII